MHKPVSKAIGVLAMRLLSLKCTKQGKHIRLQV